MTDVISWVLVVNINDGALEDFRTLMGEMVEHTKGEEGALAYEWFATDDESQVHLYERYADSAAALVHMGGFGTHFAGRFMGAVTPAGMYVYGDPSEELKGALAAVGPTYLGPWGGFAR